MNKIELFSRSSVPLFPPPKAVFTSGFKTCLEQLHHKWTAETHHPLHLCLSCISKVAS